VFYVSRVDDNGKVYVTDTSDGAVDCFDRDELLHIAKQGHDIKGVNADKKMVYPVEPFPNKFGYTYRGWRRKDPEYDVFIRSTNLPKESIDASYPLSDSYKRNRRGQYIIVLTAEFIDRDTGEIKLYPTLIAEYLDNDWGSAIRNLRIFIFTETGAKEMTCRACIQASGYTAYPVPLRALAYIDLDKARRLGHRYICDTVSKFIPKYVIGDVNKIIKNTSAHWSDGQKRIFLSDKYYLSLDEVLYDLGALFFEIDKSNMLKDTVGYNRFLFGSIETYPIFRVLDQLLFDEVDNVGLGTGHYKNLLNRSHHIMHVWAERDKYLKVLNLWNGEIRFDTCNHNYNTFADDGAETLKLDFRCSANGYFADLYTDSVYLCARYFACSGTTERKFKYTTDDLKDVSGTRYSSLYGVYDFNIEEYYDSVCLNRKSKGDLMMEARAKIVGNTDLKVSDNGTVVDAVPSHGGIIIIPDGCTTLGYHSVCLGSEIKGISVPKTCTKINKSSFYTKGSGYVQDSVQDFLFRVELPTYKAINSLLTGVYSCVKFEKPVEFQTRTARVQLAIALLWSGTTSPLCDQIYVGAYKYLCSLSAEEAEKAVSFVWSKFFNSGAELDRILFRHNRSYGLDFSLCFNILDIPKELRIAMKDMYKFYTLIAEGKYPAINATSLPVPFSMFFSKAYGYYTHLQNQMLKIIHREGFTIRHFKKYYISSDIIEKLNKSQRALMNDDLDLGW